LGRTRLELKSHLALFLREIRFEWAALFRDELLEQISLAGLQQFFHLAALDRPLQNNFSAAEIARAIRSGRLFTNVIHRSFEYAIAALGTFAHRLLSGEIHCRRPVAISFVLTEVKLGLPLGRHFDHGCKGASHFAAETLQRTDLFFLDQLLDLRNLKLPAGDDLPQAKITFLALKF